MEGLRMGIELIVAGISAAVGVAGAVVQGVAAGQAAAASKEANAINRAQNQIEGRDSRRQAVREQRVRAAQIAAAAENTGVSNSSGAVGAIGALNTNLAGAFGQSFGKAQSNASINTQNQRAADAQSFGNMAGAFAGAIQSGLGGFNNAMTKKK